MLDFLKRLFGSKHERDIAQIRPLVDLINGHVEAMKSLTDDQ